MIGQTVSHYRVLEKLGGGGMGVVYKAEDTRLGRTVALKVLPPERVADPNRRQRFIQEARAASALNHPNIITIYDIDEAEGVHLIAMEYVQGRTLDRLITRHGLPVNETLKLAVQMAAALTKAHSAGIVHRDLKPANVMVTEDGLVKVLDFGLAKLTETPPVSETETAVTREPVTEEGTIVGTAGYMSPEQAEGKPVDGRSDIFSFGSVLYEMLSGQRAFQGGTRTSTIAAILRDEPKPLSQVAEGLPHEVERIVRRCLRKDPAHRFQHMDDLMVALEELKEESDTGEFAKPAGTGVARRREGRFIPYARWPALALVATVLTLVIGGAIWYRHARKPTGPPMRVAPFTSFAGDKGSPRFSPDGNQIAFTWDGEKEGNLDIYVKLIGTEKPLRLTTDPAADQAPAWSPDGRHIAFCRHTEQGESLYVVPALGGSERKLRSLNRGMRPKLGSLAWSPDGKYLAYDDAAPGQQGAGLFLVAVDNPEETRVLTSPGGSLTMDFCPRFSPDGASVAFIRFFSRANATDIHVVRVAGGEPKRLTFDNVQTYGLDWAPEGADIVFSSDRLGGGRLWKIPTSGGEPEPLSVGQGGAHFPSLSRDGRRLAYIQSWANTNIWRYEVPQVPGRSVMPTKLITSTQESLSEQISPDGRRIAFASDRSGSGEIWVADSDGSNSRQLTYFGGPTTGTPRWSPDSQRIAFDAEPEGHGDIYVVSAEGGRPRRLTMEASNEVAPSWSCDGHWIYFASDRTGTWQVWKTPVEGGQAVQVTKQGGFAAFEGFDSKTLYYAKGHDRPGLWKVPVEGGEETLVLEQLGAGLWGYWGLTAQGVYFYNESTKAIDSFNFATRKATQIAKPEKGPIRFNPGFAVSPDGHWILYAQVDQETSDIMLVENFHW